MSNYTDIGALSVRLNLEADNFNRTIANAKKQITFLERDFRSAGKGIKNFENSFVGVNKKIQTLTQQLNHANTKLFAQQKRHESLSKALEVEKQKLADLGKTVEKSSTQWKEQAQHVAKLATDLSSLTSAMNTTKGEIRHFSSSLEEAKNKMKAMELGAETFEQKLEKLNAETKEIETSFDAMTNIFGKGSFAKAQAEMDKLASSFEQAKKKIDLYSSEIEKLNSSQNKLVSEQNKISAEIKETTNALERAKGLYGESSSHITKLNDKLLVLKTRLAETKTQLNTNASALTNYRTQVNVLNGSLASMALQMNNIPSDTVANKLTNIGRSMSTTGMMMSATIGIPLTMIGKSAINTAMDFEESMSKVQAITGASASQMEVLTNKAETLGKTTHFTAKEASEGMQYLSMAGLDVNEVLTAMDSQLALAKAGMLDLGTTADITTNIMSGFNKSAGDLEHISDVLAYASSNANTNIEQMGEAMVYLAPIGNTLGLSLEDVSSAVMAVSDAGIQGARAGAAFSTSLTRLTKPTAKMEQLMEELGISFAETDGTMKPISKIVGELNEKMSGFTETQKAAAINTLFGAEATKHWSALLTVGQEKLEANTKALRECDGTAQDMADTMGDNLAGSVKEMQSKLEGFLNTVGKALAPTVKHMAETIGDLTEWFEKLEPATQRNIITIGAMAIALPLLGTALGFVISGLGNFAKMGKMFNTVGGTMISKIGGIGTATSGTASLVSAAMPLITNPWFALPAALGVAGTAFFMMNKNSKEKMADMAETARTTASGIGNYFSEELPNKLSLAKDQINKVGSEILSDDTKTALKYNIDQIQRTLETGVGDISTNFGRIVKLVTDDFDKIPPEMRQSVAEGIAEFGEMLARDGQIAVGEFQTLINKLNEDANVTLEFDYSAIMDSRTIALLTDDFTNLMQSVGTSLKSGYKDIDETVNATVEVMSRGSEMGAGAFAQLVDSTMGYVGDLKGNVNHFNSIMQNTMKELYEVLSPEQMGILMTGMVTQFGMGTEGIQLAWDGMYAELENTDEAGRQAILQGMGAFINQAGQWTELLAGTYGDMTTQNADFWTNILAGTTESTEELNAKTRELAVVFTEQMATMGDPSQIVGLLLNLDEIVNRVASTKELSTEEANALKDNVNAALAQIDPEVITKITADTSQFSAEEIAVIDKLLKLHQQSATPTVDADTSEANQKIEETEQNAEDLEDTIESQDNEVQIDTDNANDEIDDVEDNAEELEDTIASQTNKINVDGTQAISTLDTIQAKINNLGDKTVKVNVNTNYTTTGTPTKQSEGVGISYEPMVATSITENFETDLSNMASSYAKVRETMANLDYSSDSYRSRNASESKTMNVRNANDSTMIGLLQNMVEQIQNLNARQNVVEANLYLDGKQIKTNLETREKRESRLRGY